MIFFLWYTLRHDVLQFPVEVASSFSQTKPQDSQTCSRISSFEIKREKTSGNGFRLSRCACLFNSREYFPCHNFFIGFSKSDVSQSVSTLFCNIYCCYLFFLLYLLSRDTSARATALKTSPRSKSAFSKPKCKRYTCILSFTASVALYIE